MITHARTHTRTDAWYVKMNVSDPYGALKIVQICLYIARDSQGTYLQNGNFEFCLVIRHRREDLSVIGG